MPSWYTDPPLILAIILIVLGFYILIKGADILVEGAVKIAQHFGIQPAVVGATVVAFGTSMPELVVSVGSNLKALQVGMANDPSGPAAIAIGNIVGSNIFNIAAILGLSALLVPLSVPKSTLKFDYPLMLVAFFIVVFFSIPSQGIAQVSRMEGAFLVLGLIAFTVIAIKMGKVDTDEVTDIGKSEMSISKAFLLVVLGILCLTLGGDMSLNGAICVSREMGMSERVIGLTVMAIGTSLPELATSLQAAKKGEYEIAVANVVGSNIFNVFCILGFASLIIPLPVHPMTISSDYYWMLGFGLILLPMFLIGEKLGRIKGIILLTALSYYLYRLLI